MDKISALCCLLEEVYPLKVFVEDQSESHKNHFIPETNSTYPSHVKITLVSGEFKDMSQMARQRLINKVLEPAFDDGLHAVSLRAFTPEEFNAVEHHELEFAS